MSVPPVAVGCDVVDVARIAELIARRGAARLFTASELADAARGGVDPDGGVAAERLAARYAAKEATRKVLGGRGPALRDIEVVRDGAGAPAIVIAGRPTALACSLSHDAGVAMAVVVGDREEVERLLREHAAGDDVGDVDRAPDDDPDEDDGAATPPVRGG